MKGIPSGVSFVYSVYCVCIMGVLHRRIKTILNKRKPRNLNEIGVVLGIFFISLRIAHC